MEFAYNDKDEKISAFHADYDIYFCIECGKPCGLRKPVEKSSHFFHLAYNPNCSLSISIETSLKQEISKAVEIICIKNTTKENWFKAIQYLLNHHALDSLYGIDLAIKPISLFLKHHNNIRGTDNYYKLIYVLMNTDSQDAFLEVYKILMSDGLETSFKRNLLLYKALLKNLSKIPDDLINHLRSNNIIQNILIEIFKGKEYKLQLAKKNNPLEIKMIYEWTKIQDEKKTADELIMLVIEMDNELRNMFSKEEWVAFYKILPDHWGNKYFRSYCLDKAATFLTSPQP